MSESDKNKPTTDKLAPTAKKKMPISAIVLSLGFPLVVGKCLIVFFGARYSMYPGEGYGYALLGTVTFTILSAARFIWKYRNYDGMN